MAEGDLGWQGSGYQYSKWSAVETLYAQRDQMQNAAVCFQQKAPEQRSSLNVHILFCFVIYCYQATKMVPDLSFLAAVGDLIFFLCLLRCWGLKNKWDPDIGWWVIKVRQSNQCICAITLNINTHTASSGKCMTTHTDMIILPLYQSVFPYHKKHHHFILSLRTVSFFIPPVALQALTVQFPVSILLSAHRFILFSVSAYPYMCLCAATL